MTNLYYIDSTGIVQGPVSPDRLQSLYRSGAVTAATQVCLEGTENWQPYYLCEAAQPTQATKPSSSMPQTKVQTGPPTGNPEMNAVSKTPADGITKAQGTILIILLLIGIGAPFWIFLKPTPNWEYHRLEVLAETSKTAVTENQKKLSFKSVPDVTDDLNRLGSEGWELVGVYLEHETAYPNFGKEDYVTGIQPNVRPQSLVCIFKRQKKF